MVRGEIRLTLVQGPIGVAVLGVRVAVEPIEQAKQGVRLV